MTLLGRLALLFVIVPILELMLLVRIGEWVGLWPTLALVLTTGFTGAYLARAEGMRVLWRFQQELAQGRVPGQALQDGIAVLVGGAFLITPGILTDLAGLALLFPPTRHFVQRRVKKSLERQMAAGALRFTVMGPGGFGPFGAPGGPGGGAGGAGWRESGHAGLDPDKEIRVERPGSDTRD
jgi:UPF0716 protein FxsA